ncbi:MAG: hypothetical protein J5I93_02000 [Pirellulaceae bacterium]|nr:hypothetical protein [Pirellulaceae bacterium]
MSAEFDPYRKWLGIPPQEQPPNHYRLLGIPVFEDDPDVIENAANRQMAHVRTFQAGRHGPISQRILNELSAARVWLLNPEKKQEYDAWLRQQPGIPSGIMASAVAPVALPTAPVPLPSAPAPPLPPPPAVPRGQVAQAVAPVPVGAPVVAGKSSGTRVPGVAAVRGRSPVARQYVARRRSSPLPIVLGMITAVVLIGLAVVALNMDWKKPSAAGSDGQGARPSRGVEAPERTNPPPQFVPPTASTTTTSPVSGSTTTGTPSVAEVPQPVTPGSSDGTTYRERQLQEALAAARRAMASRDLREATLQLDLAETAQQTDAERGQVDRLRTLKVYLESFWDGVRRGIRREITPGEPFDYEGLKLELVSHEGEQVKFKADGVELERSMTDLDALHAAGFASRAYPEQDHFSRVYAAALLVFDRRDGDRTVGDEAARRELAIRLLRESAELSQVPNRELAEELGLAPEDLMAAGSGLTNPTDRPATTSPPPGETPSPPSTTETTKLAPPDAAQLKAARGELSTKFQGDFETARRNRDHHAVFARTLGEAAAKETEPALRYAMWLEACNQAVKATDLDLLVQTLDALAAAFNVEPLSQKVDYLQQYLEQSGSDGKRLMDAAVSLREEAESQGQLTLAVSLQELAMRGARKAGEEDAYRELNAQLPELKRAAQRKPKAPESGQ